MLRDYVKWDDLPISLPHFAESAVRAYKIPMTPPMMPVVLVAVHFVGGRRSATLYECLERRCLKSLLPVGGNASCMASAK